MIQQPIKNLLTLDLCIDAIEKATAELKNAPKDLRTIRHMLRHANIIASHVRLIETQLISTEHELLMEGKTCATQN